MCTNPESFFAVKGNHYGLKHQKEKLDKYLSGDTEVYPKNSLLNDFFLLTGGEPTLHPHFIPLISHFSKKIPDVELRLLTNGRLFFYKNFASEFLKHIRPPFLTAISLHSSTAAKHDAITRASGSFVQTVEGVKNLITLKGDGHEIEIRVILHKKMINDLRDILRFLLSEFGNTSLYRLTLIYFECEGQARTHFKELMLPLKQTSDELSRHKKFLDRFKNLRLYHFPLCVLREDLRLFSGITLPISDRIYSPKCHKCNLRENCFGLMRWYYGSFGDSEIAPV